MASETVIGLTKNTRNKLFSLKIHPNQSYNELIEKLITIYEDVIYKENNN